MTQNKMSNSSKIKHKAKASPEATYASKLSTPPPSPNVVSTETPPTRLKEDTIIKLIRDLQCGVERTEQLNIVYHRKVDNLLKKQKNAESNLDKKIATAISTQIGAKTEKMEKDEENSSKDGYESNDSEELNNEDRRRVKNMR